MNEHGQDESEETSAAFLKEDEGVRKVENLQDMLHQLEESNFVESLKRIKELSLSPIDVSRNIIRFSVYYRSKTLLFVRLASELNETADIAHQISNLTSFGIETGAFHFYHSLIEAKLINNSIESRLSLVRSQCDAKLQRIIEDDNVIELEEIFASPDFDINDRISFIVSQPIIDANLCDNMTLIELSALCGSIKCFRFLFINDAELERDEEFSLIQLAIAGGNVEIIQILEQARILPDQACITYAIILHRIEIFDWLIEQFPDSLKEDSDNFNICIENEFLHGIGYFKISDPLVAFKASCKGGLASLTRLIISKYSLCTQKNNINQEVEKFDDEGLCTACDKGHIEVVKLLLTLPSINVNYSAAFMRTPLSCACANGNIEIVKILLSVPGIDVNISGVLILFSESILSFW